MWKKQMTINSIEKTQSSDFWPGNLLASVSSTTAENNSLRQCETFRYVLTRFHSCIFSVCNLLVVGTPLLVGTRPIISFAMAKTSSNMTYVVSIFMTDRQIEFESITTKSALCICIGPCSWTFSIIRYCLFRWNFSLSLTVIHSLWMKEIRPFQNFFQFFVAIIEIVDACVIFVSLIIIYSEIRYFITLLENNSCSINWTINLFRKLCDMAHFYYWSRAFGQLHSTVSHWWTSGTW